MCINEAGKARLLDKNSAPREGVHCLFNKAMHGRYTKNHSADDAARALLSLFGGTVVSFKSPLYRLLEV